MKDAPVLQGLTAQLIRYRDGLLANQGVMRIGDADFRGHPAIEVRAAANTEAEHIAYLDPETLFPIGIVGPDGSGYSIAYRTVEALRLAEAPTEAFNVDLPPVRNKSIYQRLSTEDTASFAAYPLWNLGPTFANYRLTEAQRYQTEGRGQYDTDAIYFTYEQTTPQPRADSPLEIIARPPLTSVERAGLARAEADGIVSRAEAITINGETATLRPDGAQIRLTLDRASSVVYVLAPSRDVAITAAESLHLVNGD